MSSATSPRTVCKIELKKVSLYVGLKSEYLELAKSESENADILVGVLGCVGCVDCALGDTELISLSMEELIIIGINKY